MKLYSLIVPASVVLVLFGCQTAPKTEAERDTLKIEARSAISMFKVKDPGIQRFFDTAEGYAVIPTVGKGAIGVGGAYGRGMVYAGDKIIGYCSLSQTSIGLALGGQVYSEVIFFEHGAALAHFKTGNFALAAQASAVAVTTGASADADYENGVVVFTMPRGGLMAEASVGGQKFSYEAK